MTTFWEASTKNRDKLSDFRIGWKLQFLPFSVMSLELWPWQVKLKTWGHPVIPKKSCREVWKTAFQTKKPNLLMSHGFFEQYLQFFEGRRSGTMRSLHIHFPMWYHRCSRIHLKWTPPLLGGPARSAMGLLSILLSFTGFHRPEAWNRRPVPGSPSRCLDERLVNSGCFFGGDYFETLSTLRFLGMTFGWFIVSHEDFLSHCISNILPNSQKLKLYELFVQLYLCTFFAMEPSLINSLEQLWVPCSILTMFPKDVALSPMGAPSPAMSITVMLVAPSRKRRPSQRFWGWTDY